MELTEKYDNASVGWRDQLEKMRFPAAYQQLCVSLPKMDHPTVADIGCGTGALSKAFCKAHGQPKSLTLLDPSQRMLELARSHLTEHVQSMPLQRSTLHTFEPDAPFDLTLCAHVIEHCPDPAAALRHLARITKPGGHIALAISKPHLCQILIWLRWQHRWFSKKQVMQMAKTGDLELVHHVPFQNGVPARVSQGFIFKRLPEGN